MKVSKVLEAIKEELAKPLPEPRVVTTKKRKGKTMAKKAKSKVEDEELDRDETDEDGGDEGDEDEAPAKKSKKAAKGKDKGKGKGKAAKSAKKSKGDDDEGGISIQDLAEEAGINAQSARVKLREAEVSKPAGGRWRWKEGSKDLKAARKALGL